MRRGKPPRFHTFFTYLPATSPAPHQISHAFLHKFAYPRANFGAIPRATVTNAYKGTDPLLVLVLVVFWLVSYRFICPYPVFRALLNVGWCMESKISPLNALNYRLIW